MDTRRGDEGYKKDTKNMNKINCYKTINNKPKILIGMKLLLAYTKVIGFTIEVIQVDY